VRAEGRSGRRVEGRQREGREKMCRVPEKIKGWHEGNKK
jgi:hypothetical protein